MPSTPNALPTTPKLGVCYGSQLKLLALIRTKITVAKIDGEEHVYVLLAVIRHPPEQLSVISVAYGRLGNLLEQASYETLTGRPQNVNPKHMETQLLRKPLIQLDPKP